MNQIEQYSFNFNDLQDIAHNILKKAKERGATHAEVSLDAHKGFTVTARHGDIETVEYHQDKGIGITVYFDRCSGSASMTDIDTKAISDAVEAACHIAKFTDKDDAAGLADKEDLAFNYPKLALSYPWAISVEKAKEIACECEAQALSYDKRIMMAEDIRVTTAMSASVYANSLGFIGFYPYSDHEISCVLVAKEGDQMQRDHSYTLAVDPAELASPETVARQAAEKTVRRLGARPIPTTKAPVIFIAEMARGLLGLFAAAIQGSSIYRKSSFLVDHLGKPIFSPFIQIQEHPHLENALGSVPFDDQGVATRANIFIEKGILQSYALGSYSARQLGMKTTGNSGGTHNLTIHSGDKDLAAMIKTLKRGLLVTEMMGQGVNLLTGDYSRGASGYWIENGEIQFPVQEVTVASTLQNMYANIVEAGNDVDIRGNIRTGSIMIEEMIIAGS